jgi:hypothetical protein
MHKLLLILVIWTAAAHCSGQALHCKFCDTGHIKMFPRDLNKLYLYIDGLRRDILIPFKTMFDSCHEAGNSQTANDSLNTFVERATLRIQLDIDSIKSDSLYLNRANIKDTSCLYYYTNKELNDYLFSLQSIAGLMRRLFIADKKFLILNEFNNINFLSAYYSMFESRSLLLSAMDNLDHYLAIKDTLGTQTNLILKKVDTTQAALGALQQQIFDVHKIVYDLPTRLNTMEGDLRKNARKQSTIWGIAGGLIGGLVAGLIVHSNK